MSNLISKSICLVLVAVFIVAGCEIQPARQPVQQDMSSQTESDANILARGPSTETVSPPYDEAAKAIKATGGLNAWKKTTELQLDCVVTLYQPDGSFYLTEQSYKVYPWSNSIQISSDEPQGSYLWQLSDGQFDVLNGAGKIEALPETLSSCCFAEAVLNIITTPVRFLDGSVQFSQPTTTVKIEGKWYYPIDRKNKDAAVGTSEAVFYQDKSSSVVDMIRLACMSSGSSQSVQYVRGYDYKAAAKGLPSIPTRIEIFSADARDKTKKRVVKIDFSVN